MESFSFRIICICSSFKLAKRSKVIFTFALFCRLSCLFSESCTVNTHSKFLKPSFALQCLHSERQRPLI